MTEFTSGPWELETYSGDPRYAEHYVKSGDHMICIVSAANHGEWRDSDDEGESEFVANARLIASAPCLLAALLAITNSGPDAIPIKEAFEMAHRAIERATS
jgi:hypothetical protein